MVSTKAAKAAGSLSSKIPYELLAPQALIGLVDALSYMVTAPSLVFYVLQSGGTYGQYGMILSIYSFASFAFKPVLGYWSDKSGGKFRMPYLSSIFVAAFGGWLYFLASAFSGNAAILVIFFGRLLGGIGAANNTLGFTYIAQVIPKENLTQASAVLSMTRIVGMVIAPGLNVFLAWIDKDIYLGSFSLKLDPLNSVGLCIMFGNVAAFFIVYFLLEEPQESTRPRRASIDSVDGRSWKFWKNIFTMDIMVPMLSIFCMNANFQLLETSMAPAASDALGWGPIGVSSIFGTNAFFIFFAVIVTLKLSEWGVSDEGLLKIGLCFSITGYSLVYILWENPTNVIQFFVPIALSTCAFPFMGAPTRSLFTRFVDKNHYLRNHQGSMQALLSMVASAAGFLAPGFISAYVLRKPEEVAASSNHRELAPLALFAPILSALTLIGFLCLERKTRLGKPLDESSKVGEATSLVEQGEVLKEGDEWIREFHPRVEAYRRNSVTLMGIPQICLDQTPNVASRRYSTAVSLGTHPAAYSEDRRATTLF
jgi:MFS family permease